MKKNSIKRYARHGIALVTGLFLGWLLFEETGTPLPVAGETTRAATPVTWTCSMHPGIRQDKPGTCPLCGMDLVPVGGGEEGDPAAVRLSREALALADVRVTRASEEVPVKEIELHGTIRPDERLTRAQVAHVKGRVEKLLVHLAGERVRRGQVIARVYSPDLLGARQELLEAVRDSARHPELLAAAREKLRAWKLTDRQAREIERGGDASPLVDLVADVEGIVTARRVSEGDYVTPGSVLLELTGLSPAWAVFDAREADVPYLRAGDPVEFTLPALPGKRFTGKIAIVEPLLDEGTRTLKVRVETPNPGGELRPGMYARAVVKAAPGGAARQVVVPRSAVLWTGRRSVVYTRGGGEDDPSFLPREVELGASLGDAYVVLSGLRPGEEVVTNGLFAIDASAQLEGKRSMMNNDGDDGDEITLDVRGACEMCRERIEGIALAMEGVRHAAWDGETGKLRARLAPGNHASFPDTLARALAAAGHDAGKYKAPAAVYNALPPCCKYRE